MKRMIILLMVLLTVCGCTNKIPKPEIPAQLQSYANATEGAAEQGPEASPVPTAGPTPFENPPLPHRIYTDWDIPERYAFSVDLDLDGVPEQITCLEDDDDNSVVVIMNERPVILEGGCDLFDILLLDLDPASPHLNLLFEIDTGSDDFVTMELHPENGVLVRGPMVYGSYGLSDGQLMIYERTELLGTASGKRPYGGDDLIPQSDWLTMSYIPTAEELENEREDLIDTGILLHNTHKVPCTIDGKETRLPRNGYIYRLRYREDQSEMEVATLDGKIAVIHFVEHEGEHLIYGHAMSYYFDNILFAD